MIIILRGKQINETTVGELEKQRQVFRNSAVVKKKGLRNPILVYEVRVKIDNDRRICTCCNNFNDILECLNRLPVHLPDDIEVEVYDNYFLEKFIKPLDKS